MRKLMWMALMVALGALPLGAAERGRPDEDRPEQRGPRQGGPDQGGRPGGRFGDREGGPRRPPGMMPGGPGGAMFGAGTRTEIFDAARRTINLPDDAKRGVDLLDAQFGEELQAGITELRLKLSKDYVAKILALLPEEEKPKYEAVAKALTERDEALAAAQKELKATLDKVKASQGADKAPRDDRRRRFGPSGGSPTSKIDILHTHFVLTEQQQEMLEETQRDNFDAMRERMEKVFAGLRGPGGPRDPNAFRRVGEAMRQVREKIDDDTAMVVAEFLTPEQRKDYATASAAIDACRKKTKDAEEACRKKIVEAVGEVKANSLLGPPPGKIAEPKKATTF